MAQQPHIETDSPLLYLWYQYIKYNFIVMDMFVSLKQVQSGRID